MSLDTIVISLLEKTQRRHQVANMSPSNIQRLIILLDLDCGRKQNSTQTQGDHAQHKKTWLAQFGGQIKDRFCSEATVLPI